MYLKRKSGNLVKNSNLVLLMKQTLVCYFLLSISLDCLLLPKHHVANIDAVIFVLALEKHHIKYFDIIKYCTMLLNNIFIQLIPP